MNFDALKLRFSELALVGEQVETLFLEEHYAQSIAQGRVFAEGALRQRLHITDSRMMLAAMMTTNAFLRLPSEVQNAYRRLRRQGNQGAHYSEGQMMRLQDAKLAEDVLRSCWVVAQDLYKLNNAKGLYPEFVLPTYEVEPVRTPEQRPTFNAEQEKVIALTQGRHLVLAPPGCGKTAVLTERVIHAMQEGVAPASMLCLTFTNRATMNMKERIEARSSGAVSGLFVGNLHKFCAHFLYECGLVDERTQVIDEDEVTEIIASFLPCLPDESILQTVVGRVCTTEIRQNLAASGAPEALLPPLSEGVSAKQRDALAELQLYRFGAWNTAEIDNLAQAYCRYKKDNSLIDFNDMLALTYRALKEHAEFCHQYAWIQIDEVQDLSELQLDLVKRLWNPDTPQSVLVYFGDEQQAIYSFLGAKFHTLSQLAQSGAQVHRLYKNYRSPKYLLELFNVYARDTLGCNTRWLPEAVVAGRQPKDSLTWQWCQPRRKAQEVVRTIATWNKTSATSTSAILVPRNTDADQLSMALKEHGIGHFKVSGADVFNHPIVKTTKAYLSVLNTPTQVNAWAQVAQSVDTTFRRKALRELFVRAYRDACWLPFDWIRYDLTDPKGPHSVIEDLHQHATQGWVLWLVGRVAAKTDKGTPSFRPSVSALKLTPTSGRVTASLEMVTAKTPEGFAEEDIDRLYTFSGTSQVILVSDDLVSTYSSMLLKAEQESGRVRLERLLFTDLLHTFEPELRQVIGRTPSLSLKLLENVRAYCQALNLPAVDGVPNYFQPYAALLWWMGQQAPTVLKKQAAFLKANVKLSGIATKLRSTYGELYRSHTELIDLQSDSHNESMLRQVFREFSCAQRIPDSMIDDPSTVNLLEKIPLVLEYLDKVLVNKREHSSLRQQLRAYFVPMCSLKEADLCSTEIVQERVFIATVHRAKGLEFDNVLVYDVRDGVYPWPKASPTEYAEAARRLYVAITRTKSRLTLLIPNGLNDYGYPIRPSPYLDPVEGFFTKVDAH